MEKLPENGTNSEFTPEKLVVGTTFLLGDRPLFQGLW